MIHDRYNTVTISNTNINNTSNTYETINTTTANAHNTNSINTINKIKNTPITPYDNIYDSHNQSMIYITDTLPTLWMFPTGEIVDK